MAKNEVTLLQEIVGQLRTLNKMSVRDRLREAEEAKRAEKLAMVTEDNVTQGGEFIDSQTDFQRRYLAGQAGAFTDAALRDAPKGIIQKVIAKATDSTHKWTAQNYRILKIQRLQSAEFYRWNKKQSKDDKRDEDELARENMYMFQKMLMPFEKIAADWAIKREKWLESKEIYKEYWQRFKWGIILTTLAAAWLAYEGLHAVSLLMVGKLKELVTASQGWKTSITKIGALYVSLRTNILKWFGYDAKGKALSLKSQGGFKWTNPLNFGAMQASLMTRAAALRTSVYTFFGLGADGKTAPKRLMRSGPHGPMKLVQPGWGGSGATGAVMRTITTNIGRILSPVFRLSGAVTGFFAKAPGKAIESGMKTIKALGGAAGGWLKMLSRILWPVTILFSIFKGFSAAKEEFMKEDSNWFTILGAAVGGVMGYLFGALADLLKSGIVWVIKSIFKLKTDDEGKVLPGQGVSGAIATFLQGFSFEDLINNLVSGIFNMVNNVVGFVVGMFTDADYRAGVWNWITELPGRIGKWIKSYIPEWLQKRIGIYDGAADWATSAEMGSALWLDSYKEWLKSLEFKETSLVPHNARDRSEKLFTEYVDNEAMLQRFNKANMWETYRAAMGLDDKAMTSDTYFEGYGGKPTQVTHNTIMNYAQTAAYSDELLSAMESQMSGY